MTFAEYQQFLAVHPNMHNDCESLRKAMLEFVNKYRMVLENHALGQWACDERSMLSVIFDNRKALALADQVPTWWENEE